jgi:hypothetical protein
VSGGWGPCRACGATCDTGCCSPGCAEELEARAWRKKLQALVAERDRRRKARREASERGV